MFSNPNSDAIFNVLSVSINLGSLLSIGLLLYCLVMACLPLKEPKENAGMYFNIGVWCCIIIPATYFLLGLLHGHFPHNEFNPDLLWIGILSLSCWIISICQIGAVVSFMVSTKSRLILVMITGVCIVCLAIFSSLAFLL